MNDYSIEITDLTKNYNAIEAVKGINLKIKKGTIFGFLGPNGAGKSTTLSMMATLLKPTSGNITILGYDLSKKKEIKHLIGLCPQDLVFYELLTARENIHLIAQMHGMRKEEYKKRLKARSPDMADAFLLCFYQIGTGDVMYTVKHNVYANLG